MSKLPMLFNLAALVFLWVAYANAGDKPVQIVSAPSGATVEVNGNVLCTTPCTLKVSSSYFGSKHTAFSGHVEQPLRVILKKAGYIPKTVELTTGPLHWRNLYGNNLYDYYLLTSDHYTFQLDSAHDFISNNGPGSPLQPVGSAPPVTSTEQVVQRALPAVVQVSTAKGSGSGFFVTPDGVLVTNAHVVEGQTSVTVTTTGGKSVDSTRIYLDDERDLALIKLPLEGTPYLTLSLQAPAPGSDVIAIGTPGAHDLTGTLMLPNTVTKGVVSGVRRFPENTTNSVAGRAGLWIQTDATINHGNSGGPLLNSSGQVVGINTLAFAGTGTPGINFALASTELAQVLGSQFNVTPAQPAPPPSPALLSVQTGLATTAPPTQSHAKLTVTSSPIGADVELDGAFLGSTPEELPVSPGKHQLRLTKKGYRLYERSVQVLDGAAQRIEAELEKE